MDTLKIGNGAMLSIVSVALASATIRRRFPLTAYRQIDVYCPADRATSS
jgi:hypothetical protein